MRHRVRSVCLLLILVTLVGVPLGAQQPRMRLAILPLENTSGNEELAWLASGIPESLTSSLSAAHGIVMVERLRLHAVLQEQELQLSDVADDRTAVRIGEIAGADALLLGSYQISGRQLLVILRLVDAESGQVVADRTVEAQGSLEDIFGLYQELSRRILERFGVRTTPAEQALLGAQARVTDSLRAYELFVRAKAAYYERSEDAVLAAVDLLEHAIAEDPAFGLAYAYLSLLHEQRALLLGQTGRPGYEENLRRSSAYLAKAAEHGEGVAEVHRILADVLYSKGDTAWAGREIQKSLYLSPMDAGSWLTKWRIQGKGDPEHAAIQRALEIDPGAAEIHIEIGRAYSARNQFAEALYHLTRAFDRAPDSIALHYAFAETYLRMGWDHTDAAAASYERIIELSETEVEAHIELARLYYARDELARCLALCERLLESQPHVLPVRFLLALSLFRLERFDEAEAMFKSVLEHDPRSGFFYEPIDELRRLEDESRYEERARALRTWLSQTKEELGQRERSR